MRRAVLLAATMAIVAVLAVGMASADPVNSKNAQIFTFDCGGEEVTLAVIFNSRGIAFNVVDTTGNFVVMRVEGTETFTDPETGEVVEFEFVETVGKGEKRGLGRSLTTCDDTFSFEHPELGTITGEVTLTGFFTPRRG